MELRHLNTFHAAAERESFTRAAEVLELTQAAVSQQIAALEKELGVDLFERKGRGVGLTDAGIRQRSRGLPRLLRRLPSPRGYLIRQAIRAPEANDRGIRPEVPGSAILPGPYSWQCEAVRIISAARC